LIRSPFKILLLALAFTWIFFFEYMPPVRWVHIPFDLEGYHFPLFDYAFHQVTQFRLPQWDPLTYSGISFIANVQTGLFYPGTWIMFLAKWGRERLSYQALQDLTLVHVAVAFTLCYWWLAKKRLKPLAALLGAGVFAYSGYMCTQLQHFGLIVSYTWMPLGLLGIDEAAEQRSLKPLWKVAVAAALVFLGGYPPNWLIFSWVAGVYALVGPGRLRTVPGTVGAFVFALMVCAVQVLPSWDATHFRQPEVNYSYGFNDPMHYMALVAANFFNFGLNADVMTNFGKQSFYLGAPGLFGVVAALARKNWKPILPALAVTLMCLFFAVTYEPLSIIQTNYLLADLVRPYYFFAGMFLGLSELTAHGLDAFLRRDGKPLPRWLIPVSLSAMGLWAGYQIARWWPSTYAFGWWALVDTGVALALFLLALYLVRSLQGQERMWVAVAMVLFVSIDYKVFNTSKRHNATRGEGPVFSNEWFGVMNADAYKSIPPHPDYRVMITTFGPAISVARHVGWRTPQGSDPMMTIPYREMGKRFGKSVSHRDLLLDPLRTDTMGLYGIRFVAIGGDNEELSKHPRFRLLGDADKQQYYKVFEYLDAQPIYQFEGTLKVDKRDPEHRALKVSSPTGGKLHFAENWYPGWSATIDGKPIEIEKWEGSFQAVQVPAGEHMVEFTYRERLLGLGAGISLVSLALLAWWIRAASSKSIYSTANPAASE
jgi:hypothetical protein